MTFWAKLLTIILFVLSIALAAASGVIFAKRQDFRAQLEATREDLTAKITARDSEIGKLKKDLADKQTDLGIAQSKINERDQRIATLNGDVGRLNAEVKRLDADLQTEKGLVAKLTDGNTALAQRNKELGDENKGLVAENRALSTQLSDEKTKVASLEKANTELKNNLEDTRVALAKAQKQIAENDEVFAALASRNIEAKTVIDGMRITPDVKAQVAQVDAANGLVVLTAGTEQGVKKNFEFTIFRNDQFVATVNVFHLSDNYCAARVVTKKSDIQLGDSAWTRLP